MCILSADSQWRIGQKENVGAHRLHNDPVGEVRDAAALYAENLQAIHLHLAKVKGETAERKNHAEFLPGIPPAVPVEIRQTQASPVDIGGPPRARHPPRHPGAPGLLGSTPAPPGPSPP